MLLPVMVAPIFAIYSHRHTIDNYTVVRNEVLQVNAFQYVENGKPSSLSGFTVDTGALEVSNQMLEYIPFVNGGSDTISYSSNFDISSNDVVFFKFSYIYDGNLSSFDGTLSDVFYFELDKIVSIKIFSYNYLISNH